MGEYYSISEKGLYLKVKVIPGSSKDQIVGLVGDRLKIKVRAAAESGKANAAVIDLVASWLQVRSVAILRGVTSTQKLLLVSEKIELSLLDSLGTCEQEPYKRRGDR